MIVNALNEESVQEHDMFLHGFLPRYIDRKISVFAGA